MTAPTGASRRLMSGLLLPMSVAASSGLQRPRTTADRLRADKRRSSFAGTRLSGGVWRRDSGAQPPAAHEQAVVEGEQGARRAHEQRERQPDVDLGVADEPVADEPDHVVD